MLWEGISTFAEARRGFAMVRKPQKTQGSVRERDKDLDVATKTQSVQRAKTLFHESSGSFSNSSELLPRY